MDQPQTQEEWEMRQRSQQRMGQILAASGPSYGGAYVIHSLLMHLEQTRSPAC